MELRSKTLSSVSMHDYYTKKLARFTIQTNNYINNDLLIKRMAIIVKWMNYHSKYFWIYIDTCDSIIKKNNFLQYFSIMYHKTFYLQEEINKYSYDEISYYNEKNFRKKCLTYRSLYEKKFEPIFLGKIPLDVLRYILLFV